MLAPCYLPYFQPRAFLATLCALLSACSATPGAPRVQPSPEAQAAFFGARQLYADGALAEDPNLWRILREAVDLAPEWVAPKRLEDDLLRAAHREVEALERRRIQLAASPFDARAAYLVARLEVGFDPEGFARVVALDPDFAWGGYALAWLRSNTKMSKAVERDWERAIVNAPTPWDAAYFARGMASSLFRSGAKDQAVEFLSSVLEELDLRRPDRAWLAAQLASLELRHPSTDTKRLGRQRAFKILRTDALAEDYVELLGNTLLGDIFSGPYERKQLELALGAQDSSARTRLLERLDAQRDGSTSVMRRLFGDRRFATATNLWLASLPEQVLEEDGLPADRNLRRMADLARALDSREDEAQALSEFGTSLLRVGWYERALQVASTLEFVDSVAASQLRRRALAGEMLFDELPRSLRAVEKGKSSLAHESEWEQPARIPPDHDLGSLNDLLVRWGQTFARFEALDDAEDDALLELYFGSEFYESPRLNYGGFAQVVHPGPFFSAEDERLDHGLKGALVPGLALSMAAHNRFAIVGDALGAQPDATVLRRIYIEERSGKHLGAAWRGTVAWCSGTDVRTRAQRAGAEIGGAALHEGYWIDLEQLHRPYSEWLGWEVKFEGEGAQRKLDGILATHGLHLRTAPSSTRTRARERTSTKLLLGEADRLRLAVLRDRAEQGDVLGEVSFTEYVEMIATHEEGHLCDRARFLPLSEHLGAVLAFGLEQGFSPIAIQERLEYRAQLVALCELAEPRIALVDLLNVAASTDQGMLGHVAAYRDLLADLVQELEKQSSAQPELWPNIQRDHTLVHQLHHLNGEEVRALSLEVARYEGLLEGDIHSN